MSKLPQWLALSDCQKICDILSRAGGESRLVGGCVRDIILGKEHSDIDIATTVLPELSLKALKNEGIQVIPTGLKHGTITAVINGKNFEITTLRKDVETDGRHAKVEFTDSWEEDAARRDFTINAMFMDLTGNIYDYFDGQEDLKHKLVKFVGDPEKRIEEDYLRVLRYFRFISYFGDDKIHNPSLKACGNLSKGLKKISAERIRVEMLKILCSPYAMKAISLMNSKGVLEFVAITNLPSKLDDYKLTTEPLVNLAVFLRLAGYRKSDLQKLATRWRLSKKEKFQLENLVIISDITLDLPINAQNKAIYKYGKSLYKDFISVLNIETPSEKTKGLIEHAAGWQLPDFKINGENIMKLGYNGPQIGKILNKLHQMWIDSDFELSNEQLLSRVENHDNK